MKISVQFPLKTNSENIDRRFGNPFARHAHTKKQRQQTRLFLDSQLPRLKRTLLTGEEVPIDIEQQKPGEPRWRCLTRNNYFRISMIRIGAGVLDEGNLWGAFKGVQDEIAAWLGINDGDRAAGSWKVAQQKGPVGVHAVRIEIEDDDVGRDVHRVVGPTIERLGPVLGDCSHCGRPAPPAVPEHEMAAAVRAVKRIYGRANRLRTVEQKALVFRRAFYALPEEQTEDEQTLHELFGLGDDPPARVNVKGRSVVAIVLHRRLDHHPDLGEFWLYEAPAILPAVTEERREATSWATSK